MGGTSGAAGASARPSDIVAGARRTARASAGPSKIQQQGGLARAPLRRPRCLPTDGAAPEAGAAASPFASDAPAAAPAAEPQPQKQLIEVTLRKPVGIVFGQKGPGLPVCVEEVTPGGRAAASGVVQVGDELHQCSAVVLKAGKEGQYEAEGYGQRPYDNWDRIMVDCTGLEFKTVMSALKSNNERWGFMDVTLVLRRAEAAAAAPAAAEQLQ